MFRKLAGALLIFMTVTATNSAFAGLIEVEFTATVNVVDDYDNIWNGNINPGDQITGTYTLDDTWTDTDPNPEYAYYRFYAPLLPGGYGFTLQLPNVSYTPSNTDAGIEVFIGNGPGFEYYSIVSQPNLGTFSNRTVLDNVMLDLVDPAGQTLNSATIDTDLAVLNAMPETRLFIYGSGETYPPSSFYIDATITSLKDIGSETACEPPDGQVNFEMEIISIDDPTNGLAGTLNIGDQISGTYGYNPDTPDMDPLNPYALYRHVQGDPEAKISMHVNDETVTSAYTPDSYSWHEVYIDNSDAGSGFDWLYLGGVGSNMELPNGSVIIDFFINFTDHTGNALNSDLLTEFDPAPLSKWSVHSIEGYGRHSDGSNFIFRATLNAVSMGQVEPPHIPVAIAPATGVFVPMQNFDANVMVDAGLPPVAYVWVELSDGIMPLPLYCSPPSLTMDGRQFVHCPNASQQLRPGMNNVTINVDFIDYSTITNTATWELVQ